MKRYTILLDTDIGPDCDDCGAIAILMNLQKAGYCRVACITNSTTNPYGAPCADAFARFYGANDIPVGELKRDEPFLDDCRKYNKYITENFDCRYKPETGETAPSAVNVMRRALADAEDGSCVICTIGQLPNAADLLESAPDEISPLTGRELIAKKVVRLVSMAGAEEIGRREYNVECDVAASKTAFHGWPTEMWLSPWETGADIISGTDWRDMPESHPLRASYRLYTETENGGRMSWDHTAALASALGVTKLFELSEPGAVTILDDGSDVFTPRADGNCRFLRKRVPADELARNIDALMLGDLSRVGELIGE